MYFVHEKLDMATYPGAHFKWSNPIEKEIEKQSFGGELCVIDYKLNNRIPTAGKNKVVLDWSDNNEVNSNEYLAVFKKSLCSIEMHDGYVKKKSLQLSDNVFPIMEMCLPEYLMFKSIKDIEISCTLRTSGKGDTPNRKRIFEHMKKYTEYGLIGALDEKKLGKLAWKNRTSSNLPANVVEYLKILARSKVIVTCGPSSWEGDSRLWEALASGACVISDEICAKFPRKPEHGKHILYYDVQDLRSLDDQIDLALNNPDVAERIGLNGQRLSMNYHTPEKRLKYIKLCLYFLKKRQNLS